MLVVLQVSQTCTHKNTVLATKHKKLCMICFISYKHMVKYCRIYSSSYTNSSDWCGCLEMMRERKITTMYTGLGLDRK